MTEVTKRHENKADKYSRLIEAAYELFLQQGFDDVSIQEIADRAGVAKGTFYLYFHDKEALKNSIIAQKSQEIFSHAISALHKTKITDFEDQIIFIVDYVIDVLTQNREALKLIAKDLSLGVFNSRVSEFFSGGETDIVRTLIAAACQNRIRLKNPRLLLYMIIEFASATSFSCILSSEPLEIAAFKPYLFDAIHQIIRSQIVVESQTIY